MTSVQHDTELTMRLDGEVVSFTVGETIYAVAKRHGKAIPTLCYDPRLDPFGACRLCVVEVKGARTPVASCTALAQLDIEVFTASARVERHRKTLLELVASENGGQIDVDPLHGYASQELAQLCARYDARPDRFAGATSGHSKLDDPNPFILRDYDRCISCYRCVRVCAEQAPYIVGRRWHSRQKIRRFRDGEVEIRFGPANRREVEAWVRQWGDGVLEWDSA